MTFRALLHHIPRAVTWCYIPEAAPWWGGYWERLVGMTKRALRAALHQCHLSYDELSVVMYEVAFFLNLRPLTADDGGDVLTPARLIFGARSLAGVLSRVVRDCFHPGRAWRCLCRVSDDLRRRWKREYLESLRCWRHPGGRPARLPKVGEVVLVGGVEPRGRWTGPGADPGAERRLSCGLCGDTRGTYPPTDCEIIPAGSFARLDVSDHYRPD